MQKKRLAFVVSHPIQYYAPLYRRLALRNDMDIKVFFTWHDGTAPVVDDGFGRPVEWDVPLVEGYEHELVPNHARHPGTGRFLGLNNPSLADAVLAWRPDAVHVTGYAWLSHLLVLRMLHRRRMPVLFRGDSHLLGEPRRGVRWWTKRTVLRTVYSWPTVCLYVGQANKAYYEAFGVLPDRLRYCPHSIDTRRFCEPAAHLESEARAWREGLGLGGARFVLVFAGKLDRNKRPLELMRAVQRYAPANVMLLLVGAGELEGQVRALAAEDPSRFRVLPFQNQSRMPLVYRIGDVCVLPSSAETWGLAVNEALACGRPVIVSDSTGCSRDLIVNNDCGWIFPTDDWSSFGRIVSEAGRDQARLNRMRAVARSKARAFDVAVTAASLSAAVHEITRSTMPNVLRAAGGRVGG